MRSGWRCYSPMSIEHPDAVDFLLEKDGNWNMTGVNNGTALHRAAGVGDLAMVERLVAKGADLGDRNNPFTRHAAIVGQPCQAGRSVPVDREALRRRPSRRGFFRSKEPCRGKAPRGSQVCQQATRSLAHSTEHALALGRGARTAKRWRSFCWKEART